MGRAFPRVGPQLALLPSALGTLPEWEKPARHTGTLHLLSDPKYIKMGTWTPATRSGSGTNWGVVKIADLSLFSQEKYLFHRALLSGKLRL